MFSLHPSAKNPLCTSIQLILRHIYEIRNEDIVKINKRLDQNVNEIQELKNEALKEIAEKSKHGNVSAYKTNLMNEVKIDLTEKLQKKGKLRKKGKPFFVDFLCLKSNSIDHVSPHRFIFDFPDTLIYLNIFSNFSGCSYFPC